MINQLYDSGKYEESLRSYQKALQRDPKSAGMHRSLGDVLQRLGRAREARAEYERSIEMASELLSVNPRDIRAISLIALCERRGVSTIASVDSDFAVYRLPKGRKFENVFFSQGSE